MQPDTEEALDRCVLTLYRAAREQSAEDFSGAALQIASTLVPFDFAVWSRAALEDGKVHLYSIYDWRLPAGTLDAWDKLKDRDVLGAMAFAQLGRTVIASPSRSVTDDEMIIKGLIEPYDIGHVLTTCLVDPFTSLFSSIMLIRRAAAPPFTETERRLKERLTPHLVEAHTSNLLRFIEAKHASPYPYAAATCNSEGLLEFASRDFATLLCKQWPAWRGPRLPAGLPRHATSPARHVFSEITVRSEPAGRVLWLRARAREAVDSRTREIEVARLSAEGHANKEIALALALSPFTVRNHLDSVYRKLGIAKRGKLGAFASELDIDQPDDGKDQP